MNTNELKDILGRLELDSLKNTIDFIDLYEEASRRPSFTFTGEFSSGKTSLIEELLGEAVGKVDILEATRRPILFVYSMEKKMYGFKNTNQVEMISFNELDVVSSQLTSPYEWLFVCLPNETLKNFNIVDTPGTNASSTHQVLFIPNLQYVFCSPYGEVMTETKKHTLEKLKNHDIYFVATKADLVDLDEEEEIEEVHEEILEDYSFRDQVIYSILDAEIIEEQRDLKMYLNEWSNAIQVQYDKTITFTQIADTLNGELVSRVIELIEIDNKLMSPFVNLSEKQHKNEFELLERHDSFQSNLLDEWRFFKKLEYDISETMSKIRNFFDFYENQQYKPWVLSMNEEEVLESSEKNIIRLKSDIVKLVSKGMNMKESWMYNRDRTEEMEGYQVRIDDKYNFIQKLRAHSSYSKNQLQLMKFEEKEVERFITIFLTKKWYENLKSVGNLTYNSNSQEQYQISPKINVQDAKSINTYIVNIVEVEQYSKNIKRSRMLTTLGNGIYNSEKSNMRRFGFNTFVGEQDTSPWRANRLVLKQLRDEKRKYLNSETKWFLTQDNHKQIIYKSHEEIQHVTSMLQKILNKHIQSDVYTETLDKILNEMNVLSDCVKASLYMEEYTYKTTSKDMHSSPNITRLDYFIHQTMYPAFFAQSIWFFTLFYVIFLSDLISNKFDISFPTYVKESWFWIPLLGASLIITFVQHRLEDRKHTVIPVTVNTLCGIATLFVILILLSENF